MYCSDVQYNRSGDLFERIVAIMSSGQTEVKIT
jgi:hypothetical protein